MKKQTQRPKKAFVVWIAVLAVIGLGVGTFSLLILEGDEFHKGSFAYYVWMPKDMREMPTVGRVKHEPIYRYVPSDGQPAYYILRFETDLAPEDVKAFYQAYFSKQGLQPKDPIFAKDGLRFSTKDGYFDYEIATDLVPGNPVRPATDKSTSVRVTLIDYEYDE